MLRWYYSVDSVTVLEITDRVNWPDIGVGSYAEEGSGWSGELLVDDPDGDLMLLCWRRIYAVQDAASGRTNVGNWFISDLDIIRDNPPVEASRKWIVTMVDENSLLERRILVGADAVRPAETDIARIRWLLTTTEANTLSTDEALIDTTSPVNMDAVDYTGQKPADIIADCQQQQVEGWNYFVPYVESVAVGGAIVSSSVANPTVITTTTAHGLYTGMQVTIAGHSGSTPSINGTHIVTVTGGSTFTIPVNVTVGGTGGITTADAHYALAYFNFNTSSLYPSTLSLSNVESEVRADPLVYPIAADTRLSRSGMRLASGEYLPYSGGYVYVQNVTTGTTYVYRDVAAPAINVKTVTQATDRVNRHLAQMVEPEDEITSAIVVEEADLNLAMHGMSIPLRATHLPDYTATSGLPDYANGATMRIKRRDVTQLGPTTFRVGLVLTPMTPTVDVFVQLQRPQSLNTAPGASHQVGWSIRGDDVVPIPRPTVGPLHATAGSIPNFSGVNDAWAGVTFDGSGTVNITSSYRVFTACSLQTVRLDLILNGTTVVATGGMVTTGASDQQFRVDATGIAVANGDVLTAFFYHDGEACEIYVEGTGDADGEVYNLLTVTGSLVP